MIDSISKEQYTKELSLLRSMKIAKNRRFYAIKLMRKKGYSLSLSKKLVYVAGKHYKSRVTLGTSGINKIIEENWGLSHDHVKSILKREARSLYEPTGWMMHKIIVARMEFNNTFS